MSDKQFVGIPFCIGGTCPNPVDIVEMFQGLLNKGLIPVSSDVMIDPKWYTIIIVY